MFVRRIVWIDVNILFNVSIHSMGIRCNRREALVSMEGVVLMSIGMWILMVITFGILIGALVYSIYMAIWGVYDEY